MVREKMLDKIQQLLAIAEGNGASENESFMAAQQAQKLMVKHAIDEAELMAAKGHKSDEKPIVYKFDLQGSSATFEQKYNLLRMVAYENRCVAYFHQSKTGYYTKTGKVAYRTGGVTKSVTLVGFESDVHAVELLFSVMQLQMMNGFSKEWEDVLETRRVRYGRKSADGLAAYRRGFYAGFTSRLQQRLREANREIIEESGASTELVLMDRKIVVDLFAAESVKPKTVTLADKSTDWFGYQQGKAAADSADIGQTKINGKREIEG